MRCVASALSAELHWQSDSSAAAFQKCAVSRDEAGGHRHPAIGPTRRAGIANGIQGRPLPAGKGADTFEDGIDHFRITHLGSFVAALAGKPDNMVEQETLLGDQGGEYRVRISVFKWVLAWRKEQGRLR